MENKIKDNERQPFIDLSFNKNSNLIQAILNGEVFGKPKCKTRRRRVYGTKGINR